MKMSDEHNIIDIHRKHKTIDVHCQPGLRSNEVGESESIDEYFFNVGIPIGTELQSDPSIARQVAMDFFHVYRDCCELYSHLVPVPQKYSVASGFDVDADGWQVVYEPHPNGRRSVPSAASRPTEDGISRATKQIEYPIMFGGNRTRIPEVADKMAQMFEERGYTVVRHT